MRWFLLLACSVSFSTASAHFRINSSKFRTKPDKAQLRRGTLSPNETAFTGDDLAELEKRDGTKYVFMHHIVGNTYPYTQADWEDDIRQIGAKGVDAIALNIGSSDWQRGQIASAYAAASVVGGKTKLFISFDFTEMPCDISDVVSRVNQWTNHPYQFKVNGKPMISSFSGGCFGNSGWQSIKDQTGGYLMPFISGLEGQFNNWPSLDSWQCWGCAWPQGDYTKNTNDDNYYISQLGSRYAATVSPWFYTHYSYKNYVLNADSWLIVLRWEQLLALRNQLTFVELISWNDYGESHYLGPIKGAQPSGTTWTNGFPHTAWYDLCQYYITAFQTGSYPAITKDVIYFWARPHPVAATASSDSVGKPSGWDWVEDSLWVTVFSTSSASVTLQSGSNQQTSTVSAGITKLKLALAPGKITVSMSKNGQTVINYTPSDFTFITNPTTYNYNAYVDSATATSSTTSSTSASSSSTSSSISSIPTSSRPATSTSSSTTSTSSSTTPSSTSTAYTYLGCYVDPSNSRVLNGGMTTSSSQTVSGCLSSCGSRGFAYAGTEYGNECWCGSSIASGATRAAESDCSKACSGKSSDICGGSNRISLYRLSGGSGSSVTSSMTSSTPTSTSSRSTSVSTSSPTSSTSTVVTSSTASTSSSTATPTGVWSYVGCIAEGTTGSRRALTGPSYTTSNMTSARCQALCSGYTFAGTEYGSQCYCGNTLTNNGATGSVIDSSACNSACSGDSSQKCGGSWTLSLYAQRTTMQAVSWSSAGCYTDGSSRILRGSFQNIAQMTTEKCTSYCSSLGYLYAATEYGTECYCGSQFFKENGAGSLVASTDCNTACAGDSSEKCGAAWRANVYQTSYAPSLTRRQFTSWRGRTMGPDVLMI